MNGGLKAFASTTFFTVFIKIKWGCYLDFVVETLGERYQESRLEVDRIHLNSQSWFKQIFENKFPASPKKTFLERENHKEKLENFRRYF